MKVCLRRFASLLTASFVPLALLCVLSLPGHVRAQDEPDSASDGDQAKSITVNGVFEAIVSHELSADTEQIDSWTIKRILPHGSTVKKGQNVVWFETEDAEEKLKDAERALRLAKIALEDEEFQYEQFLETQRLDRQAAQRAITKARKDYDHFVQTDQPRLKRTAEFNVKSAVASLANAQEELKQLEQMYKEDDLTEESEEIVLKRAKQAVESAEFRLEGTKIQSEQQLERGIAEQLAQQEDALARAQLTHQAALHNLDSARRKRDIEIAKKRLEFQQQQEEFDELKAERQRSVLTAPIDGLVMHGELNRGRLGDKPSTLEAGSKVTAQQAIATVVDPSKLQIRVDLSESDLPVVQPGSNCQISVPAVPSFKGRGTVKSVAQVPYAATKYDALVTLKNSKATNQLLPTMTCKLELTTSQDSPTKTKKSDKESDAK